MSLLLVASLVVVATARSLPATATSKRTRYTPAALNNRPIIGILSQPGDPAPNGESYIAASYVKWVEAAGARVIPIFYDMTKEQVRRRFEIINGLLLPGGGANLSPGHPFYDTAKLLVDMALEANDNGDYFPVHGTCLGLELLSVIFSGNTTILGNFNASNAPAELLFTAEADSSYFFAALPPHVVRNLQDKPIAMENHEGGVSMRGYDENPHLHEFFKVLSLSLDKSGDPYISTVEARKYPITATQWHPEKNAFEWSPMLRIPHTPEAVDMCQEVANFFVSEARKNKHAARDEVEEDQYLIYNWKPHFTGLHHEVGEEVDFEQSYYFSRDDYVRRQQHRL